MKVSIGAKLHEGPWGGGNQFAHALTSYLSAHGCQVSHDLIAPDLDIILLFDPRLNSQSATFSDKDILYYLREVNSQAVVVHRVNECDERKGTTGVNQRLIEANLCADHTVFVSTWLQNLFLSQGIKCQSYNVILNGSDTRIFNSRGYQLWDKQSTLRVVTHHWGGNWLKGFDIYQRLDNLLATTQFQQQVEFTYIGNLPPDFYFSNATYIPPLYGAALADALRNNHVYLTASQHEPGGNHQNEGANCGLPLLYRESGCLPEYCDGFGISFNEHDFEDKLSAMIDSYDQWVKQMPNFPRKIDYTVSSYFNLFKELIGQRNQLISTRLIKSQQISFSSLVKAKIYNIRHRANSSMSTLIRKLVK